jgi:pantetheine-phosphate adenylyltransferase
VDFARAQGANAVIRGIRAVSDYEYEFQMAMMNRKLDPELETLFMMPAEKYTYVSSRLIKGVFQLGGDISSLVPAVVVERLKKKKVIGAAVPGAE